MRNQRTEAAKPDFVKSVVGRLHTPIVHSCLLTLIAQIAQGIPLTAEAQNNSRAAEIYGQKETAPAPSKMHSGNQKTSNNVVRLRRRQTS